MPEVNPGFSEILKKYGAFDMNACYNCGSCTAVCAMSDEENSFPRRMVRYSVLGLDKEIQSSLDPWLCYYCGECSSSCPRDAQPGELMMSLRRWQTSKYDWTGFSRKFYTSKVWELAAIGLLATLVLVLFILFHGPMTTELTAQGGVKLNTFAPWRQIETGDWIMAGILSFFLISNILMMYLKVFHGEKKIKVPLKLYFTQFWKLIFHFATQWRFNKSNRTTRLGRLEIKASPYWISHWLLMSGYVLLFTMIVVFLEWFQTDFIHPWWHPQRIFGYYATFGLSFGIVFFVYGRIKKDQENNKHTHFTDWTFLVLLSGTVFTGILVHIFRISGLPYATYYAYVIHLMILVPMLMIEVPFSKWSHLTYRPFAVYFSNLQNAAYKK
jgi:quinone-modifying oxidoreductase, subunit QmoC